MTEREKQLALQALRAFRVGDLAAAKTALDKMSEAGLGELAATMEDIANERDRS